MRDLTRGESNQELFFGAKAEEKTFAEVLEEVRSHVAKADSELLLDKAAGDLLKRNVRKYLMDQGLSAKGYRTEELVDAIYEEMAGYSILTKYVTADGVEEVNVNSWKDVQVQYADGREVKVPERFESPEHAVNVLRRMLHASGNVLDSASPVVLGHLGKNVRIAVMKTPVVDEEVGVAASIRIVNPQNLTKDDFLRSGTATEGMLDFLTALIRHGVSVCVAGATSSGKTTLTGWLLTTIPNEKRVFTIENGSRELALVREKDGRVLNNVVHTLTRPSENPSMNVSQEDLLDVALRFDPEIICVGEMRSSEAYAAQEAARTGHTVISTVHSNSCEATYGRIVTLCKRASDMGDETLMKMVTEAFPVIVFTKKLDDKKRKVMEILECEVTPEGKRNFRSLYRYEIKEVVRNDEGCKITGAFVKGEDPSEGLCRRLLSNGMPKSELEQICARE
ncbi:MAG: CpaF family protein [Lachnospiraceae bacterium]|nr:CpaF family protein [Lachnospiraceae bacterium]